MTYAFGNFVLDLSLFQLRRGSEVIPLEPKVFDVLRYLVEHHDRVATKRELLDALWPSEVVTEAVLPTNINALRRALGQGRGEKTPIETVHGRGYRFALPVVRTLSIAPPESLRAPLSDLLDDEESPLIGQGVLLEKLKRALSRSLAEQGQIVILRGETGIGKSRIAKRIADLARSQGADVWLGGCPEGVGTPPLWVWQEVLRSAKASEGGAGLRRFFGPSAGELSPWLSELLEEGEENMLVRGERDRFRLYDALVRLLSAASKVRPRVIVLEDLHRADDASWQLLRLLAPHLAALAVMMICTVRSRDDLTVAMGVQRHVEDLSRLSFCQRFQVMGLSESDSHTLLEKHLGKSVPDDLARLLHQKTAGNPLFLRELSEGLLSQSGLDADSLRDSANLSPPELVRRVLLRRVSRLGPTAQEMLSVASVIGNAFNLASVATLTGMERPAIMDVVDAALESRVIMPLPDQLDGYRFAHELIRDTLYAELRGQERQRLHQKVAELFARRASQGAPDPRSDAREIASHFYRALPEADPQEAVSWLARAADESEKEGAYADAVRLYRSALEAGRLLKEPDVAGRATLESALARATEHMRAAKSSA